MGMKEKENEPRLEYFEENINFLCPNVGILSP